MYRERQVNSALIPAIHKYTDTIWLEQPFKKSNKEQRFLDIVTAKDKNIYCIELKHTRNSQIVKINEHAINEWDMAIKQISTIENSTLGALYKTNFNMFKIALMIMPTYLLSSNKNAEVLSQKITDYNKQVFDSFTDNKVWAKKGYANLVGTIKIKNPKKYKHEWEDGCKIYPFVSFVARIEKI